MSNCYFRAKPFERSSKVGLKGLSKVMLEKNHSKGIILFEMLSLWEDASF